MLHPVCSCALPALPPPRTPLEHMASEAPPATPSSNLSYPSTTARTRRQWRAPTHLPPPHRAPQPLQWAHRPQTALSVPTAACCWGGGSAARHGRVGSRIAPHPPQSRKRGGGRGGGGRPPVCPADRALPPSLINPPPLLPNPRIHVYSRPLSLLRCYRIYSTGRGGGEGGGAEALGSRVPPWGGACGVAAPPLWGWRRERGGCCGALFQSCKLPS